MWGARIGGWNREQQRGSLGGTVLGTVLTPSAAAGRATCDQLLAPLVFVPRRARREMLRFGAACKIPFSAGKLASSSSWCPKLVRWPLCSALGPFLFHLTLNSLRALPG